MAVVSKVKEFLLKDEEAFSFAEIVVNEIFLADFWQVKEKWFFLQLAKRHGEVQVRNLGNNVQEKK